MSQGFGVIILAAGASARRGRPKQLLPYLGRTLIEHAARTALASGASQVIVVAGSEVSAIREKLKDLAVQVVWNRFWNDGLASSIRAGIRALSLETKCAVIALGDQPKITPQLLRCLAERQFETGSPIVASSYDGILGAPSAFGAELFPALASLQGNIGARELIRQSEVPIESVEFSGGNVDVEVPIDLGQLVPETPVGAPRDQCGEPQDARGPPQARLISLCPA